MPVIALLTDFGLREAYLGAMKGAILSVCPRAALVDLVHELPAHDLRAGALALEAAYPVFPDGTVFLAVVDPGVGGERRAVAAAAGRWLFVAPDNGILSLVLTAHPQARVRELLNPVLRREPVSPVFHGRDLFGPAAGHLARGLPFSELGPLVPDPVRLALPEAERTREGWRAEVLCADRFGNLTTSLRAAELAGAEGGAAGIEVVVGGRTLPLVRTYGEVGPGEPCALVGSGGRLELAVNRGRADGLLGEAGMEILVRWKRKGSPGA
jgi:S-adenosylmethionine hydrolase